MCRLHVKIARVAATPVLLDCDPGHDDAVALLLALASPELELVGVTTVSGNQTLEKTTANALRVLELAGRAEVPVAAGADRPLVRPREVAAEVHGETGLDGPELPPAAGAPVDGHAVAFLAGQIRARAGAVTLVATGPLTNVALLLALEPDARPQRIVVMGGAVGEGNRTPAAEFNVWADPEAARRVFESGIETTMVGLDVTHRAVLPPASVEELRAAGRVGRVVAELLDFFGRFHEERYPELGGAPLHDPVAVAHVIDPGLLDVRPARIEVDCGWEQSRGRTNVDWRRRAGGGEPNARVALGIDPARFARLLVERIASLG
jgi:inosine-uridine nucleoside N-ribohydrolase